MQHSDQTTDLIKALLLAEADFGVIELNKTAKAGSFTFKYADLTEVYNKTKPALRANGLKCFAVFESTEGKDFLTTTLMHVSGQWIKSTISINAVTQKMTDLGAIITYMRRYAYVTLLGIAADEDVEGDNLNQSGETMPKKLRGPQVQFLISELKKIGRTPEDLVRKYNLMSVEELSEEQFRDAMQRVEEIKKTMAVKGE